MSFEKDYAIEPIYKDLSAWELYAKMMYTEYRQCVEEGLDIEQYKDLMMAIHELPTSKYTVALSNVIFDIVKEAEIKEGYKYNEPSDLEGIKALRKPHDYAKTAIPTGDALREKISGAWYGRICGCLLGKTVEGMKLYELVPFLKDSGNYPMHRYIYSTDVTDEIAAKYNYKLRTRLYADTVECAPWDDDTNYLFIAQRVIEKWGRDFTPFDMSRNWLQCQTKDPYCTAERVALLNFIEGYVPPVSAVYKNPFREWIGAQIRGDYFGYINPGNTELAAEMAFRDACISHTKNGIYGEMFVTAMVAAAAVTNNIKDIIYAGLAEIPATSRLYESIMDMIAKFDAGMPADELLKTCIYDVWNDRKEHDWCHTISNALVVVYALLVGGGDYGKSICLSVEAGFDTDCNGATVGSILGMMLGEAGIDDYWKKPTNGVLDTTVIGCEKSEISKLVEKTLTHMPEELK